MAKYAKFMRAAVAATVAVATVASARAEVYTLSGGSVSPNDGKIIVTGMGTYISKITANPENGETIVLTGDEIGFSEYLSEGGEICLSAGGMLVISNKVVAPKPLKLTRSDGAYMTGTKYYDGTTIPDPLSVVNNAFNANPRNQYFPGLASLSGWTLVAAVASTNSAAPGKYTVVGGPYDWQYGKYFCLNRVSAGYVYSMAIDMNITGGNGYARIPGAVRSPRFGRVPSIEGGWETENLYTKWLNAPAAEASDDEKAAYAARGYYGGYSNRVNAAAGDLGQTSALGIYKLILRKTDDPGAAVVRFEGGVTISDTLQVDAGVEAVLAASEGDGGVVLRQPVSGDGDVKIVAQPPKNVSKSESDFASGEYDLKEYLMPESLNGWRNTIWNRDVSKMTGCSAVMTLDNDKDHSSVNYPNVTCVTNHFKYHPEDNTVTCQFECQINPTYAGRIRVKFRQRGAHIQAAVTGAGYLSGTAGSLGEMTSTGNRDIMYKTNFTDSVFCDTKNFPSNPQCFGIHSIRAFFEGEEGMSDGGRAAMEADFSGLVGGTLSFEGGDWPLVATVSNTNSFPWCGVVNVATNAEIMLDARGITNFVTGISEGSPTVNVTTGGVLRIPYDGQIGQEQRVVIDGGLLRTESTWERYVNDLTLRNGAKLRSDSNYNKALRMNANSDWQMLVVEGTVPAAFESGLHIIGASNNVGEYRPTPDILIDVREAEGSFSFGKIAPPNTGNRFYGIEKYGPGTLVLNGANGPASLATTIYAGKIMLAANNAATNAIVLAGGDLWADAGTTNVLGTLSATVAGGGIHIGSGAVLKFADSRNAAWYPETMAVYGFEERSLWFGKSRDALNYAQRMKLKTDDGKRLYLYGNGQVSLKHPGMITVAK